MSEQTWETTWSRLAAGNARFAAGACTAERGFVEIAHHLPRVAVLACSDARVPVELVFDAGAGELFVVRTAGHTVDTSALASLEYAAEYLATTVVVVLGHSGCGAVDAAWQVAQGGAPPSGYLGELVRRITPAAAPHITDAGALGAAHVRACAAQLIQLSPVLAGLAEAGSLHVIPATYCLETGEVHLVS